MKTKFFLMMAIAALMSMTTADAYANNKYGNADDKTSAAKEANDTVFIVIEEHKMFTRCFAPCDTNGDGIVTYLEAAKTETLGLDLGGRMNIITDYTFLKHFRNLKNLSVGNTTVTTLDLTNQPKLEQLNLTNALWLEDVTLAAKCQPQVFTPSSGIKVNIHEAVHPKELPEEYAYWEAVDMPGEDSPFYVVSKDGSKYGLFHAGKLLVPCNYSRDEILYNCFTAEVKELN